MTAVTGQEQTAGCCWLTGSRPLPDAVTEVDGASWEPEDRNVTADDRHVKPGAFMWLADGAGGFGQQQMRILEAQRNI